MGNNFDYFENTRNIDGLDIKNDTLSKDRKLVVKVEYDNNRLNKRIFYDKDGKMKYIEVFEYRKCLTKSEHIPEEKCISKIYKPNDSGEKDKALGDALEDNLIGYRFYAQGYEHTDKGYFTLVKQAGVEDKYSILEEESNENLDAIGIMNELFKFDLKDRNPYLVNGSDIKTIAFFTVLEKYHNKNIKNGRNSEFCIAYNNLHKIINETVNKEIFTQDSETKEVLKKLLENVPEEKRNKKIIAIPILMHGHATTLLINHDPNVNTIDEPFLFDSSLVHCEKDEHSGAENGHPKVKYFGKHFSEDTSLLNGYKLQVNGTCTYWNYCFLKIISEDKRYEDFNEIKKDFNSGKMQLRLALEMSKIFDNNKEEGKKTIIEKDNENEINDRIFFKFKFESEDKSKDKWYGVNKDIRVNKFLRLELLNELMKVKSEAFSSKVRGSLDFSIRMQKVVQTANKVLKNIQNKLNTLASITNITNDNKNNIFKDWKKELSDNEREEVKNFKKDDKCSEEILNKLNEQKKNKVKELKKSKKHYLNVYYTILSTLEKHLNNTRKFSEKKIEKFEGILEKGLNKFDKNTAYGNIRTIEDEDYENTIFETQDQILSSRLEQSQQPQNKPQPKQTKSLQEQTKLLNSLISLDQDISKLSTSNGIGLL